MKRPLPLLLLLSALLAVLPAPASAQASPGGCELAPAPRLHVGDEVVVSPEIGQVNLRSLPAVSTGIETALYQGNRLTVLAGPSCNRHFLWWRVETASGRRGWVAEGTWERYYLVPAREADAYPARDLVTPVAYACEAARPAIKRCIQP
jgi:hypothetical protein